MLAWNVFNTPKIVDEIRLKKLYSFMFKVCWPKCVKISDGDEFQIRIKVKGLKPYLILILIRTETKGNN